MKLFILLINVIYIFGLILANNINKANNTSNINKDCQIYYSIIGREDGSCNDNSYNTAGDSYAITRNGRITKLYLNSENMKKVPPSIGELSELESIDLYIMPIKELPNELIKLKKLKALTLFRINLEKIPPFIGEISELESLIIKDNEVYKIKEIPEELFKLKKLKELTIGDGNRIGYDKKISIIPTSIGKLSELEKLQLDGNQIKELPNELFQLKKLKELSFNLNDIETIPSAIGNLSELELLSIDSNGIKKLPDELFNLKKLKELKLRSNLIEEIPPSIENLTELEKLDLYDNFIKELPDSIKI